MTSVVRPSISASSASCTTVSLSASSAFVASSRSRIGALFRMARAMAMPLALSAGERHAALADAPSCSPAAATARKSSACAARAAARIAAEVGVGVAEADVLFRASCAKIAGVLRHQPDPLAKRRRIDAPHVEAVEQDAPVGRIVEAHEKREERRLAGARRADDRDALAAGAR